MPKNKALRRLPAEWELQSAVQLTFPHAQTDWADLLEEVLPCFVTIAETISRFEKVIIVSPCTTDILPWFQQPVPDSIIFFEAPTNDTWARDHGGITIEENGRPLVLDFVFNGWGLKFPADQDNRITRRLWEAGFFKTGHRYPGLALEGGGIESDGQGTLLTTAECLLSPNRNPHLSKKQVEQK